MRRETSLNNVAKGDCKSSRRVCASASIRGPAPASSPRQGSAVSLYEIAAADLPVLWKQRGSKRAGCTQFLLECDARSSAQAVAQPLPSLARRDVYRQARRLAPPQRLPRSRLVRTRPGPALPRLDQRDAPLRRRSQPTVVHRSRRPAKTTAKHPAPLFLSASHQPPTGLPIHTSFTNCRRSSSYSYRGKRVGDSLKASIILVGCSPWLDRITANYRTNLKECYGTVSEVDRE